MQPRTQPPDWDEIAGNFDLEGGELVDLHAPASPETWGRLFALLRSQGYPVKFSLGPGGAPLPATYEPILDAKAAGFAPYMEIQIGAMTIHVYNFYDDEMELSIKPREVRGPEDYKALCAFIRRLGDQLQEPAILVQELDPENQFLIYRPADRSWTYLEKRLSGTPTS
jgi:hypothetical protein